MNRRIVKVALTGQLGGGKSSAAAVFLACGIPVMDSDRLCRHVAESDKAVREAIAARFGSAAYGAGGSLDRKYLSDEVFSKNPDSLKDLESIIYPVALPEIERFANSPLSFKGKVPEAVARFPSEDFGDKDGGVFASLTEVPLLFEKNLEGLFDKVVCVVCSDEALRRARLVKRGLEESRIPQIDSKQLSAAEKMERADYIIDNNSDFNSLEEKVRDCVKKIKEYAGR